MLYGLLLLLATPYLHLCTELCIHFVQPYCTCCGYYTL